MLSLFLNRWVLTGVGVMALAGFVYYQHSRIEYLKMESAAQKNRADAIAQTLQTYQDSFKNQVNALNTERQQEIRRQENLLRTLNLIGDLHENENTPVPAASLSVIDSLYAERMHRAGD